MDPTQAPGDGQEPGPAPPGPLSPGPGGAAGGIAGPAGAALEPPSPQRGLVVWLGIVGAGTAFCALLGHPEAALFFAGAGVFALAQATDAAASLAGYRHWVRDALPEGSLGGRVFRTFVRGIVPGMGAVLYLGLGSYASDLGDGLEHRLATAWCFAAAAVSLALAVRPVADRATALLFRSGPAGRTRRLAARLVVIALMLPVPMHALFPDLLDAMRESPRPLADAGALVTQLFGEVAVALAGVGWLVRRRWRDTLERLALSALRPSHAWLVLAGLLGAVAINAGMESLQRTALPDLWRQDQEVTRLIAGRMAVWTALLLGLSAGVGEEVVLRGALQPRLGVVLTAVVFACAHVQYSWFGMLTIALLGVLLGVVRRLSNTTVAIVVHGLYDIFAVLTSRH